MTPKKPLHIFISWSGNQSKDFASTLNDMLCKAFQTSIKTYYSESDIMAGDEWYKNIQDAIKDSDFCIICLTRTNIKAPWINFEAGALSVSTEENTKKSHVAWIPIGDNITIEKNHPLYHHQKISINEQEFLKLFKTINISCNHYTDDTNLKDGFNSIWKEYDANLKKIVDAYPNYQIPGVALPSEVTIGKRDRHHGLIFNLNKAQSMVFILGINFTFARDNTKVLLSLANKGIKIRLLALDPDGKKLPYFVVNTDISECSKRSQIVSSYSDLPQELIEHENVEFRVVDEFFSSGCIGIDTMLMDTKPNYGIIYASTYLFNLGVNQSPVLEIHRATSPDIFDNYSLYLNNLWNTGTKFPNESEDKDNVTETPQI